MSDTKLDRHDWEEGLEKIAGGESVPVYMNVKIGRVDPHVPGAAKHALAVIGEHWDVSPFEGQAFYGSYSFELDEHRFEVTVTPLVKP